MNYQTFQPRPDLKPLVKCFWTLEVPAEESSQRQRILPDGCIELIFILGDDVKRIISEDKYIIQPRTMVIGQITEPFFVEPGYVHSFAVRFYPFKFANFVPFSIKDLANKETPADFSRAVTFYQKILNINIEVVDMHGTQMGLFPSDGNAVSVTLIKGEGYKPSMDGTIVYLNPGENLQTVLDKVEANGGKILVHKTEIDPDMGFFAMFTDTEGNKLALHSKN